MSRTGGRSARVVSSVLSAAVSELTRSGYDGFRVDAVASAAGVNKTSVYRRWPTKLALVAAALRARPVMVEAPPDEGTLRTDLILALERACEYCASIQYRDTRGLLQTQEPEVDRLLLDLRHEFYDKQAAVVEHAINRGELPVGTDAHFMLDVVFTQVVTLTLRTRQRLPRQTLEQIVELVVRGAEHGGAQRQV
ncbi:MAG TPA: TetR/AcrR family transcriptional regulator [Myxococcota bacterium]|nr:TetR/AcrR family transcriptional regulator [Myxococcota bacterium]